MKFYTQYKPPVGKSTPRLNPSLTQQQFGDEVNINKIIKRAETTGFLSDPLRFAEGPVPKYGDFTQASTYHEALIAVQEAQEAFMALPAEIRARFDNNPQNLMDFIGDDKNKEEAINLGLIQKIAADPLIKTLEEIRDSVKLPDQAEENTIERLAKKRKKLDEN